MVSRWVAAFTVILLLVPVVAVAAPQWQEDLEARVSELEARVTALEETSDTTTTSTTEAPPSTTTIPPTTTSSAVETSTTTIPATTTTVSTTSTTSSTTTQPSEGSWPSDPSEIGVVGTGLSYSDLTVHEGDFITSFDGQIVERLDIRGRFRVRHDNVTLRQSRVLYTTNYGIDNRDNHAGLVVEDVELDGSNLPADSNRKAGLAYGNGYTLRRVHLHNAPDGFGSYGNTVIEDSILVVDTFTDDGAHRAAAGLRGSDHTVVRSKLICDVPQGGCSAALSIYGYPHPVHNVLVEDNLFGATAGYCLYAGSSHDQEDTANVRIINNGFDPSYTPESETCGRAGDITAFDSTDPGNLASGNYYWPSLEPIG